MPSFSSLTGPLCIQPQHQSMSVLATAAKDGRTFQTMARALRAHPFSCTTHVDMRIYMQPTRWYTHTHISYRLHVCMSNKPALTIFHLFRHFSLHVSQSRLMCSVRRAEETGLSSKSAPRVRVREPSCSLRGNPALASSLWQSSFRSEATTFHSDYFPSLHPELPYLECSFTSECKF